LGDFSIKEKTFGKGQSFDLSTTIAKKRSSSTQFHGPYFLNGT